MSLQNRYEVPFFTRSSRTLQRLLATCCVNYMAHTAIIEITLTSDLLPLFCSLLQFWHIGTVQLFSFQFDKRLEEKNSHWTVKSSIKPPFQFPRLLFIVLNKILSWIMMIHSTDRSFYYLAFTLYFLVFVLCLIKPHCSQPILRFKNFFFHVYYYYENQVTSK